MIFADENWQTSNYVFELLGGGGVENYHFFSFRSSNSAHQKDFNALLGLRGIDRLSACFNERTIELYTNLMLALWHVIEHSYFVSG